MISIKKILVTTDLSKESRSALEYAVWIASNERALITLLYCVDNLPSVAYHTVDLTFDKFREELLKQEQKRLNEYATTLLHEHHNKVKVIMLEGNASQTIISYAKENNFDMIVMNTHGRTGIQHAVLGSIAEKVVRHAPCPVLTIRSTIAEKVQTRSKVKRSSL
ncbi:MAG: universal stress protein [Ignavibacteriales bacterium]|nr:universal stress protein [Ignavibacteriales bacterium]